LASWNENETEQFNIVSLLVMSAKETLSKIAGLLNVDLAEQVQEVSLESMKLDNGTVIEAESFEAGSSVFIATEDEKVALPIGDYNLEDGRMMIIVEEGVIAEIREAGEESEEEVVEEEMAEEKEEEMAYATKEELGAAMDELKGMIEEVKQMMNPKEEEEMSAEEHVSEEATEEVKMSAQEPAAKPIKANPEAQVQKDMMKFANNGRKSTLDRVLGKIAQR
jgi:hypothetical protein